MKISKAILKCVASVVLMATMPASSFAQQELPTDPNKVYDIVEQTAVFPNGPRALYAWIRENLQYPQEAKEKGVEGRCIVSCIIERNGQVSNVKITKSAPESEMDAEAIRLVESMPRWTPARAQGVTVRSKVTIPVSFTLK